MDIAAAGRRLRGSRPGLLDGLRDDHSIMAGKTGPEEAFQESRDLAAWSLRGWGVECWVGTGSTKSTSKVLCLTMGQRNLAT